MSLHLQHALPISALSNWQALSHLRCAMKRHWLGRFAVCIFVAVLWCFCNGWTRSFSGQNRTKRQIWSIDTFGLSNPQKHQKCDFAHVCSKTSIYQLTFGLSARMFCFQRTNVQRAAVWGCPKERERPPTAFQNAPGRPSDSSKRKLGVWFDSTGPKFQLTWSIFVHIWIQQLRPKKTKTLKHIETLLIILMIHEVLIGFNYR